jgi:acyl dehydratase
MVSRASRPRTYPTLLPHALTPDSVRRVDPAAQGNVYGPVEFEISPGRVAAFQTLFDGPVGVHPTLLSAAEFSLFPSIMGDPELGLDFPRVVHGSQKYEYRRPLRVGETLAVEAHITSIRHKGGNGFLTVEMRFSDGAGDLVATATSTMIEREGSG